MKLTKREIAHVLNALSSTISRKRRSLAYAEEQILVERALSLEEQIEVLRSARKKLLRELK